MYTADLNEASHEHDEGNAHQQHCPPVGLQRRGEHKSTIINTRKNVHVKHCRQNREVDAYHDPLCNVLVELGIEDGLLQPGQWSVCVHQTALHEHIAVTLEVVARRARRQRGHFLIEEASEALRAGAAARVGIHCWDEARPMRFKLYNKGFLVKTLLGRNKGEGLTLLHAAHVAKFGLVLAILASAGARLKSVLLTDGTGAALRGRGAKTGQFTC